LAGLGAWLGKPEGLAARSSIINISKYLQHVNGLSTTGWGAFFMKKFSKRLFEKLSGANHFTFNLMITKKGKKNETHTK
jgi:hypothetical protein